MATKPTVKETRFIKTPYSEREWTFQFTFDPNGTEYTEKDVDYYEYQWIYSTTKDLAYYEPESGWGKADHKTIRWTAPDAATRFKLKVRPVGKAKSSKDNTPKFVGETLTTKPISIKRDNFMPEKAPAPTLEMNGYNLTVSVTITDPNTTDVIFEISMVGEAPGQIPVSSGLRPLEFQKASYTMEVTVGKKYVARCIAYNKKYDVYTYEFTNSSADENGERYIWSDYSDPVDTIPGEVPKGTLTVTAKSSTSVLLKWEKVDTADSYEIQYTNTHYDYFSDGNLLMAESTTNEKTLYNLETGSIWWFRVRSKNAQGVSGWTLTASIRLGRPPSAPTTWSNVTTAMVSEPIVLYWIHNTADNSHMRAADIEISINNGPGEIKHVQLSEVVPDEQAEKNYSYELDRYYPDHTNIKWRVRTRGILKEYSPWSVQREINVYRAPFLYLLNHNFDVAIDHYVLTEFPLKLVFTVEPVTQIPVDFHVTITSKSQYNAFDGTGNIGRVNYNDVIYSATYSYTGTESSTTFGHNETILITPEMAYLMNGMEYHIDASVTTDCGLSSSVFYDFIVRYTARSDYYMHTTTWFDKDSLTSFIEARCYNRNTNTLIPNVHFSIMRIEYDNKLTTIIDQLSNDLETVVIDPHPNLDYMRYRVVIFFMDSGQIDYFDIEEEYVGIKEVVINWDESGYGRINDLFNDDIRDPRWYGGMLRLPWNIDVTDRFNPEVETVDYIGREYSVAYYGTKVNHNSTWSVMIDKEDRDTVLALRAIGVWRNNVYVREPSGTGYWATVEINMSQKHNEPGVPISLTITRVEGGE